MNKPRLLYLLFVALWGVVGCDDDNMTPKALYEPTVIPTDVTKLYETRGDETSDTVWVYVQGGPVLMRDYSLNEKDPDTNEDLYPYFSNQLVVYPIQSHHLNSKIGPATDFTFENAKTESSNTAKIVKMVVDHFESADKTVYVIGHSYGSLVVHEVLARYGSIGRKMISLNGRLDMDNKVVEGFSRGELWTFNEEGETPTLKKSASAQSITDQNMNKLAAGLGFNRYTQELTDADLSNVIFLGAENDTDVGDYTPEAVKFLNGKAEAFLGLGPGSGHGDIFNPLLMMQIYDEYIISVD